MVGNEISRLQIFMSSKGDYLEDGIVRRSCDEDGELVDEKERKKKENFDYEDGNKR